MQPFFAFVGARLGTALLGLCCAAAAAQSPEPSGGLRLSGFGTLGLVHAQAPAGWGYLRDIDQPAHGGDTRADTDSRLGVRAQYVVSPQFDLVAQAVGRRRAPGGDASDAIEWAYAAWRPRPDVALRVGRVSQDAYLQSEYRDVGFAYLAVRPPAEVYGFTIGPLDGLDLAKSWSQDGAQWRLKATAGRTVSVPFLTARVAGVMLSREAEGLLLRLAVNHASVASIPVSFRPLLDALSAVQAVPLPAVAAEAAVLAQRLQSTLSSVNFMTAGAQYERDDWLAMAETTQVFGHNEVAFPGSFATQLGRSFGALTLFGGFSRTFVARRERAAPDWESTLAPVVGASAAQQLQAVGSAAAAVLNRPDGNQRTRSLGLRWDAGPTTALKLQTDWVRISPNGSQLWARADARPAHATVTSLAVDFLF